MNERIKELALKAKIEFTLDPTETPMRAFAECWVDELEEFAELIVRECVDIAYQEGDNVAYLALHFGVEKTEKAMQEVQRLGEEIQPDIAYSVEYDALYYIDTGEWIDPKCGDTGCHFCNGRPENMKAERVDKTEKDRHEKFCDNHCVWTDHHPDCPLKE